MRFPKTILKALLASVGLEVRRIQRKPESAAVVPDLLETHHLNNCGIRASFLCPLSKCVILNGFSLSPDGWHPFVAAADEHIDSGPSPVPYQGSFLERYYATWQPSNALEALIGATKGPEELVRYPAYTMHNPWLGFTPAERKAGMERVIQRENRWAGQEPLDAADGYGIQGPVSRRKGEVEHQRLRSLVVSIQDKGYDRSMAGDVTGMGIVRGGDYRVCVAHGQHRLPVLAALGHGSVPVALNGVVFLEEVQHWTQVHRGVWSPEQAMRYIDHLFDFDAKSWAVRKGLARTD